MATLISSSPLWLEAASGSHLSALPASVKKFLKACTEGRLDTVKQLLESDAALLTAKDKIGRSGYALALLAGHKTVADWLKQAGYKSDLHEAALALDWERFNALVGEEDATTPGRVNAGHAIGGCAMWAAAAGGAGADIWRIYSPGGDPNCVVNNPHATSALQKALRFPDRAIAEMTASTLLGNNADANLALPGDLPPLHIAAERGSYELVEMLIRLGAEVNNSDTKGRTAKQLAEQTGQEKIRQLLAGEKAIARTCRSSRDAYTADGSTYELPELKTIAYFLRSKVVGSAHGNLEYVQKALESDPLLAHSIATTNEKAVEACAHTGRKPIVELLLQHGAPYSLPTAVMMGDYSTVKRLLDEDPKRIQERGAHDFALLWYPIIGNCPPDMMQLLLDRGAEVEQQHFLGTTALHWAAMRGEMETAELLIDRGANVNRVGRKFKAAGESPLQLAKDEKIAGLLRSRGAK